MHGVWPVDMVFYLVEINIVHSHEQQHGGLASEQLPFLAARGE
jgi:hypothetical protein